MTPKQNLLRTIRREGPEWVPNRMESVVMIDPPVVERPGQAGSDAWGVEWALEPSAEGGTYPAPGGHTVKDLSRWCEELTVPDPAAADWSGVESAAREVDRAERLVSGFIEMGLFERSYLLMGMDEALMAYVTEPDLMDGLVAAIADYKIALIERFDDAADLDMVWYGDDWGTQDGLFMSPDAWRKVIRPHTARIYDCMKRRDIIINQHSCGRIEEVFADLCDMGADVWNPCQPCNDLARLKREFGGRIAFCGGIDSQHVLDRPGVTPDEVREEVRRRIREMATGGGYVAAPSHSVPYDEDLRAAMNDEIASFGRAFYARA